MTITNRCAIAALALSALSSAAAQKPLTYKRDTSWNVRTLGIDRLATVRFGPDWRMVLSSEYFNSTALMYDSAFNKLPWKLSLGRSGNREIAYVYDLGFTGKSVWVLDQFYQQVAITNDTGGVEKSIGFPSWVRPFWKDRRAYPLFAQQQWRAVYDDGTTLVEPSQPRHLFDTPGYDRTRKMLVRIDEDGRILKTVATMSAVEGRFQMRSGTEKQWVTVPAFARPFWKVSVDGKRVAVVEPIGSDSGAFRVTTLDENGDTVFSRRYAITATRVSKEVADAALAQVKPFGRYTVEQMRDTLRKLMPVFQSPVQMLDIGIDNSIWVWIKRPNPAKAGDVVDVSEWFVLDARGEPQGILTVPRVMKIQARSLDRFWVIENDRAKNTSRLVRYWRTGVTTARPSRSGPASGSSR